MDKKIQSKNRKNNKIFWLILSLGSTLLLTLGIVVSLGIKNQNNSKTTIFEKTSQDFAKLYDLIVPNYVEKTSKFTCSNLNMKFSEGSLICNTRFELEFDMNDIDTTITTQLEKSTTFETVSKDDAQILYDVDAVRWRVQHKETSAVCTIDRAIYMPEQYQSKYHTTATVNRVVVIGDCSSDALESVPKGYTYLKN